MRRLYPALAKFWQRLARIGRGTPTPIGPTNGTASVFSVVDGKGVNGRWAIGRDGLRLRDGWYYVTAKDDFKGPFPTQQDAQLNAEKSGDGG